MVPIKYTFPGKIPTKIFILFLSFFIFVAGLYYLTQRTYKTLLLSVTELSKPDELANMTNELLFDISQANLSFQSYSISGKPVYLQNYFDYSKTITGIINKLKKEINGRQQTNIDTLELLWKKKDAQIQDIMDLIGSDREIIINPLALSNSRIITDTIIKQIYISFIPVYNEDSASINDSFPEPEEKKGVKQWFRSIFRGKKTKVTNKLAEPLLLSQNTSFKVETDTIITKNRTIEIVDSSNWMSMVSKYKHQNLSKRMLQKQLINLIQNDAKISKELEKIGLGFRDQIYLQLQGEKRYAKATVGESLDWMNYAGLATFGLCFLFVILIIKDIVKGEYYRNSLEKANATIHNNAVQKEKFLYAVSHELRTPLTAILGFAEQIGQTELKPKVKQYNHIIINAANHLLETVNEVLDIAKIESGKLMLHAQELHLPTFLGTISDLFKMDAEDKGVDFKIDMHEVDDEYIWMDAFRMKQILINLISNALKFTEKGQVHITLLQHKGRLTIQVADTGKGIEASKLSQIFEEYVQADKNDWLKYKGTGLGLSITKKIVDAMQGTISVQSEVGIGSTFSVDLPYTAAQQPNGLEIKTLQADNQVFAGKNILSVEDDTFSGLLIYTILSNRGAVVTLVSDGEEALKKLKTESYDLIITDIQIPKISGTELVSYIKENNINSPVLVLSATPTQLKYEVPTFLKPFKENQFVLKVLDLMQLQAPQNMDSLADTKSSLGTDQKEFMRSYTLELRQALANEGQRTKAVHEVTHKLIPFLIYHKHEALVPKLKQLETMLELNTDPQRTKAFSDELFEILEQLS